jgi:tRNA threonylcarbamoyladenosine biosynthesis protein TsaB
MMLALDTATEWSGVAFHDGSQLLVEHNWLAGRQHTVGLASTVREVLRQAGADAGKLTVVAVAIGPGSYSGLRAGLSLAKGLVLASGIAICGIPTLDGLALAVGRRPLWAVLRAGRGRLAAALYDEPAPAPAAELRLASIEELADRASQAESPTWVAGELAADERELLRARGCLTSTPAPGIEVRRAGWLAEAAWLRLKQVGPDTLATLSPIYLPIQYPLEETSPHA